MTCLHSLATLNDSNWSGMHLLKKNKSKSDRTTVKRGSFVRHKSRNCELVNRGLDHKEYFDCSSPPLNKIIRKIIDLRILSNDKMIPVIVSTRKI